MSDPEFLSADDFVAAAGKRRFAARPCPFRPGKSVRVRSLFENEQTEYELDRLDGRGAVKANQLKTAKREYIALCVVDGDGNPVLTPAHVEQLENGDTAFVTWVYKFCLEHNGQSESDVEDLVKNSGSVHADDSSSS